MKHSSRALRYCLLHAVLALCWIGVWHLGRVLEITPLASLWFPPAAMSFALFVAEGRRAISAVMVGVVVTNFQWAALQGDSRGFLAVLGTGLAFGTVHVLSYDLGARIFDRRFGEDRLGTPRSVVGFLVIATASSLAATLTGIGSLILTGSLASGFAADVVPWWVGDLVAVVTLSPLFMAGIDRATRALDLPSSGWAASLRRLGPADTPLTGFVLKLVVSLAVVVVFGALASLGGLRFPVALVVYAVVVPLMWIAHTEGGLRTVVAVAVLATAVVAMTRTMGLTEHAFSYQAAMLAIAGAGLFNLAVPRLYADNRRLLDLVTFDQLTGARSRPAFFAAAEAMLAGRRKHERPCAVIMFDLDRFKEVNDTLGHAAGDAVLARMGEVCRRELRGIDLFGRIGGDEFAVLTPDTELEGVAVIAERLRHALASTDWGEAFRHRPITASFGAVETVPGESLQNALARADRQLYESKDAGRDAVSVD